MYHRTTEVINKSGLHARPAATFVSEAIKFKSAIKICNADKPNKKVNAKSVVLLLSLSLMKGKRVEVSADGEDERAAVDTLIALIDSGLEED